MKIRNLIVANTLLLALSVGAALADTVETKDGARYVGKVKHIDGSTIVIETKSAGVLKVSQSEVVAVTTEVPANIRLTSGTVILGTVSSTGSGAIAIAGPEGSVNSTVDKLAAVWTPGEKDPEVVALQRAWSYQAAVDMVGKSGNSEQLGTGFSFRAVLVGPQDKLQFYTAYDRQVTEGEVSADQFKAGTDYQNSFSGRYSWYLRDEAGFDRVKLIDFSNIAAAGFGYDFIKKPKQTFTGRMGFAHRFESYRFDPETYLAQINAGQTPENARRLATKESLNSAGLDVSLTHLLELSNFSIANRLSYTPSFKDFADYRITHESYIELPLSIPSWKLRTGISNDYVSQPVGARRRLDTTYFTHLVLNWK
jgi:hypothetical protein